MARFAYMGPEFAVHVFGTTFPKDEFVSVEDPYAIAKLSTHPEFIGEGATPPPRPKKAPKVTDGPTDPS